MSKKWEPFLKIAGSPLLIAAISTIGYLIAYQYGTGYLRYFGIPPNFVELNLINVIVAISGSSLIISQLVHSLDGTFSKNSRSELARNLVWAWFIVTITIQSYLVNLDYRKLWPYFLLLLIWILLNFIYYKNKKVRSFFKGFNAPKTDSFLENYFGISVFSFFIYVYFTYTVIGAFSQIGFFVAKNIETFNSIEVNDQLYVVVGNKENDLLIMPVDETSREIKKKLFLYNIDNLSVDKSPLNLEKINNVHLKQ